MLITAQVILSILFITLLAFLYYHRKPYVGTEDFDKRMDKATALVIGAGYSLDEYQRLYKITKDRNYIGIGTKYNWDLLPTSPQVLSSNWDNDETVDHMTQHLNGKQFNTICLDRGVHLHRLTEFAGLFKKNPDSSIMKFYKIRQKWLDFITLHLAPNGVIKLCMKEPNALRDQDHRPVCLSIEPAFARCLIDEGLSVEFAPIETWSHKNNPPKYPWE